MRLSQEGSEQLGAAHGSKIYMYKLYDLQMVQVAVSKYKNSWSSEVTRELFYTVT